MVRGPQFEKRWARQSRGLNPSKGKRFSCPQKCPDWLRGPPNLLCNDWFLYWGKKLTMNRGILFHSMDRGKFAFQFISESRMLRWDGHVA